MEAIGEAEEEMTTPPTWRDKALDAASDEAGSYLENLGKTDLAELTEVEWRGFVLNLCLEYHKSLVKELEGWLIPF